MSDASTTPAPAPAPAAAPAAAPAPAPAPAQTAAQSEISGRKVFFIYPTVSVQQQIIPELAQHEFEVYSAKKHQHMTQIFKKYPNSVAFINIDEGMAEKEWETWISGIQTALPDIKIGVLSSNAEEEQQNKFTKDIHVACGYIISKLDMSKALVKFEEILNSLNVKGRRKYLRASTVGETTAVLNMPHGTGFINAAIKDISVVGISCVFEQDIDLAKNALFKDLQVRLQTMLLKVEAIVFGSRIDNGEKIYVFLFTQRIDPSVRVKIRKYIQQNLQAKMDPEIGS
jgi:hypothetical protein